jgi:hypothetical protein
MQAMDPSAILSLLLAAQGGRQETLVRRVRRATQATMALLDLQGTRAIQATMALLDLRAQRATLALQVKMVVLSSLLIHGT